MDSRLKPMTRVQRAKENVTKAEQQAEIAREDLKAQVVAALDEGIPAPEIAAVLKVSRQRVYQMRQQG